MTTLTVIADGLYASGGREPFAFLLADAANAPASLTLSDTWSDGGGATAPGTYVFLDALPHDVAAAAALASALRAVLPAAPVTTGFAWALVPPQFALVAHVAVGLDGAGLPAVAADAPIDPRPPLPPAPPRLVLAAGMAVRAAPGPFALAGWALLPQPLQESAASGDGVALPLLGADGGDLSFRALLESRGDGAHTVKALAEVRYDPLRPLDPKRTSIRRLGPRYELTALPGGEYRLAEVVGAGADA